MFGVDGPGPGAHGGIYSSFRVDAPLHFPDSTFGVTSHADINYDTVSPGPGKYRPAKSMAYSPSFGFGASGNTTWAVGSSSFMDLVHHL